MMGTNKYILISVFVAIFCVCFYKIRKDGPKPEEGVLYYYICSGSVNRTLLTEEDIKKFPFAGLQQQPFFVIIHGYTESSFQQWVEVLAKALLEASPSSCVLLVDHWNLLDFSRPLMDANLKVVSENVARVLLSLVFNNSLRFSDVHIIGFSLGGRIAGMIPSYLGGNKIGRITGVDASFPWKETSNPDEYLDSDDADLVVTIRTSRIGLKMPPINYDFYVNGGEVQPGCDTWWHPDFIRQICSHYRAPLLLVNHLLENSSSYTSCQCPDRKSLLNGSCDCKVKNSFGLFIDKEKRGTFYLETPKKYDKLSR